MIVLYVLIALVAVAFVLDRVTAAPRARAVRASHRVDEARRLVRRDDWY